MNVKRGLFRFWVIFGAIFAASIIGTSYPAIKQEFSISHKSVDSQKPGTIELLPIACSIARGLAGSDYLEMGNACYYEMKSIRILYPEYDDLSDEDLEKRILIKANKTLDSVHPWRKVAKTAGISLGFPAAFLIFGWFISWAVRGFYTSPTVKA